MRFLFLSVLIIGVGVGVVGCEHDDGGSSDDEEMVEDATVEAPRSSPQPELPDPVAITWDGFDMTTRLTVGGQPEQNPQLGQLVELHMTVHYRGSTPTNIFFPSEARANFFIDDESGTTIWSTPPGPPTVWFDTVQPNEILMYTSQWVVAAQPATHVLQAEWEARRGAPRPQFWFRVSN